MTNSQPHYDYLLKYIIIGDSGVGKSNIFLQFLKNTFKSSHEVTIGVEFGAKNITIDGKVFRVQLWDTAGQETFKSITRVYYKSSACAFLVYDITVRESLSNIYSWMEDCIAQSPRTVTLVLVGNKKDLENERKISYEEGKEFAKMNNINFFFECSAKSGEGIQEIFNLTVKDISNKIKENYYDLMSESCGIKLYDDKKRITVSISQVNSKTTFKSSLKCCD